jgi:hypothetical protein
VLARAIEWRVEKYQCELVAEEYRGQQIDREVNVFGNGNVEILLCECRLSNRCIISAAVVVVLLCAQEESEERVCSAPLAMDVFAAQTTRAVRVPSFLTEEEAFAIHTLAGKRVALRGSAGAKTCDDDMGVVKTAPRLGREIRSRTSSLWEVLFLQTDGLFASVLPGIRNKALSVVREVDAKEQWGLLTPRLSDISKEDGTWEVSCRVVEYHTQVAPTDGLRDVYHYDQDSLITLDVMLSDPGGEFTGGEVQTLDKHPDTAAEGMTTHDSLRRLDALCFVSHKYHCVRPVHTGTRRVLVFEFWRGSAVDRTCPHRCLQINRPCALDHCSPVATPIASHTGVPFRLAAISGVASENSDTISRFSELLSVNKTVWGGHWTLLWQAGHACDSVDDRPPIVIAPLDSAATKQLEDMFGDDDSEEEG